VFQPDLAACQALGHEGACWGVVAEKAPQWLMGRYPPDERWRPALAMLAWCLAFGCLLVPRWKPSVRMGLAMGACLLAVALMRGGWSSLASVPWSAWGGLPLTLLVATVTLLGSAPLAMLWAWDRHRGAPPIRWLCTACIETLRGAPLVMWLFMAAFMLPALWGPTVDIGLLPRVLMVTVPFSAAYMAEIFRGALAAVQPAQEEAARTLGAHTGQVLWRVVMPQAWRVALPSLTSHSIGVLKDTALISVVGLHELQGSLGLSLNGDADWRPFFLEAYLAVGAIYLGMGMAVSALGRRLEARHAAMAGRD
jgi:general L-amino acid transport system permease protein